MPSNRIPPRVSQHRAEASAHRRKRLVSLTAFTMLLGGVTAIGYGLFQFALAASQRDSIHPTAIPWLLNKAACEQTERFWEEGKCWDAVQSPDF